MGLLELAERCEKAEGPDRKLDIAIALAMPSYPYGERACRFFNDGPYYEGADDRIGLVSLDGEQTILPGNAPDMLVPGFTASLDAALTLVPEGWTTALYQQDKGWAATLKKGFCTSYTDVVFNERGPNGHPATPALALTAACLRARSTMEGLS